MTPYTPPKPTFAGCYTEAQLRSEVRCKKNNTTGYVGVAQDKRDGRWAAYYGSKPKRIHIGRFENAESAHLARVQYLEAHGIGAKE